MKEDKTKEFNHIKIGAKTRVRSVISYALLLLKERNFNDVTLSAIGGAIGSLVNAVEVIKADVTLYQNNKISTVSYQTMDSNDKIIQERLYPKMEVILSKEEPKNKNEGYQGKLNDDEKKKIKDFMDKRRETRENDRKEGGNNNNRERGYQGRGVVRGSYGNRGNRGGFRDGRGAPRGGRGFSSRGGPVRGRGFTRGGPRGGFRGGPRGGRGFRGNSRRGSLDRDTRRN